MFKKKFNNQGFTLVELIVTAVLLTLLGSVGFVSYNGFAKDGRDATRLQSIKQTYDALKVYQSHGGSFPDPDSSVNIVNNSGSILSKQGYAGTNVLQRIGSPIYTDSKNLMYLTYTKSGNGKNIQLLSYFESQDNGENLAINIIPSAYAAPATLQDYYPYAIGKRLGVLIESGTLLPIHETTTSPSSITTLATAGNTFIVGSCTITDIVPIPVTETNVSGIQNCYSSN